MMMGPAALPRLLESRKKATSKSAFLQRIQPCVVPARSTVQDGPHSGLRLSTNMSQASTPQPDPNVLKNQFLKAEAQVNEGRVQVPESLKYKLYGLGKQVVVGDCKMPQPPS